MATVDFRIKNLKAADGTKATLAEISGSIDATSIVQFQNVMDKLVEKGVRNLILDCANVKYINSTGLGTLLKYVDTYESMDGHIAFTRVPSKVMLVMEMLGFNALFTIVPDEAAALRFFAGKPAAAPAATPASPPKPAPTPVVVAAPKASPASPTISPAPTPPVAAPAQPAPAPQPAPTPSAGYPTTSECVRCRVALDVSGPGKFKCPRCEAVLVAEPGGKIRYFAPKRARPVSVAMPARPELAAGLASLVEGVAKEAGFNETEAGQIGKAVATISARVTELAYGGDSSGTLHVIAVPDGKVVTVRISDYGKKIPTGPDGAPADVRFAEAAKVMDSVRVSPNPKGGNLVIMTKKSG